MSTDNIDFKQLKEKILPYFIEVYGEEFRDIIVARMNQIEPIFYSTVDSKKTDMYTKQSAKRIELTFRFLEHSGIQLSQEAKDKVIKSRSAFILSEIPEAKSVLQACFGSYEYIEAPIGGINAISRVGEVPNQKYVIEQSVEALKKLGIVVSVETYDEWILTDEAKLVFAKIDELKNI